MHVDHSHSTKLERIHLYSYQYNEIPESLSSKRERGSERISSKRRSSEITSSKRRSSDMTSNQSKMEVAKEHLMLSHIPEHIPCRENERKMIADYIKNSVLQKGNGSPLYISGINAFAS